MTKKPLSIRTILVGIAIIIVMLGCNIGTTSVGKEQTDTQSIELGSASIANIEVYFGPGKLTIGGGAASLMEGTFHYNVDDLQPKVNYNVSGEEGKLTLDHKSGKFPVGGQVINDWDLRFNNDVPIEMLIRTGTDESVIDLSALEITAVTVNNGIATTTLDLTGNWNHDVTVTVTGGGGEITINLPADMGVKVNSDPTPASVSNSGLNKNNNTYTNDAFGSAPYTLTLELHPGVGSVNLVVAE